MPVQPTQEIITIDHAVVACQAGDSRRTAEFRRDLMPKLMKAEYSLLRKALPDVQAAQPCQLCKPCWRGGPGKHVALAPLQSHALQVLQLGPVWPFSNEHPVRHADREPTQLSQWRQSLHTALAGLLFLLYMRTDGSCYASICPLRYA